MRVPALPSDARSADARSNVTPSGERPNKQGNGEHSLPQSLPLDSQDKHPSPLAPLANAIGRTRFFVLVAVVSVMLVSVSLFALGAAMAVNGAWHVVLAIVSGEFNSSSSISVELLEVVSVLLKAVVFYLIGVGFYSLFVAPLNVAAALGITSFNDLEIKVVSVIIVIMGITFLERFIVWDQPVETLLHAVSLSVVVVALVFFQKHSHREAIEDVHEDAPIRVRAQRQLFHGDTEEREVRPEEAAIHRPPEKPDAAH